MQRVVLITGVAGGIGRATAQVFSEAGWHVIGVDRRAGDLTGTLVRVVQADVSDPSDMSNLFEDIARRENRIDALVNNAAVQVCKTLVDTSLDEWEATIGSNLRSVYLAVRHGCSLIPAGGAIVNVSSVHAVATSPGIAAYAASKGALLALTRALALEFGPHAIRVNAVLPGAVDTPMLHAGLSRSDDGGRSLDELVRGLGKKHVMNRVGTPMEIGKAILFLADSTWSSFMTGQALIVDGGATARLSTE